MEDINGESSSANRVDLSHLQNVKMFDLNNPLGYRERKEVRKDKIARENKEKPQGGNLNYTVSIADINFPKG